MFDRYYPKTTTTNDRKLFRVHIRLFCMSNCISLTKWHFTKRNFFGKLFFLLATQVVRFLDIEIVIARTCNIFHYQRKSKFFNWKKVAKKILLNFSFKSFESILSALFPTIFPHMLSSSSEVCSSWLSPSTFFLSLLEIPCGNNLI